MDESAWEDAASRDFSALGLVAAVIDDDPDLMMLAVAGLDRAQIVELAVQIAGWFCWAMSESHIDPREHVQHVALDLARRASGLDPDV